MRDILRIPILENKHPDTPSITIASFSANPSSGYVPLEVNFADQSEGEILSWGWDFGDGSTSTEQSPSHTYTNLGNYIVKLTVTDVIGIQQTYSYTITANDDCPNDPNKVEPGICGCGVPDTDTDLDGTQDCNDNCPNDPDKLEAGICGCGVPDIDTDSDGILDCIDNCPFAYNSDQTDSDGDENGDACDNCPNDPGKIEPSICGCGIPDTDSDGDGMADCWEEYYGLNPSIDDANDDLDGDGFSNIDEYNRGTDPADPNSYPSKAMPWIPLLLLDD